MSADRGHKNLGGLEITILLNFLVSASIDRHKALSLSLSLILLLLVSIYPGRAPDWACSGTPPPIMGAWVAFYSLSTLRIAHSRLVPQRLSNATWFVICPIENTASQYFRKYELAASTIGQMTNSNTLY